MDAEEAVIRAGNDPRRSLMEGNIARALTNTPVADSFHILNRWR